MMLSDRFKLQKWLANPSIKITLYYVTDSDVKWQGTTKDDKTHYMTSREPKKYSQHLLNKFKSDVFLNATGVRVVILLIKKLSHTFNLLNLLQITHSFGMWKNLQTIKWKS